MFVCMCVMVSLLLTLNVTDSRYASIVEDCFSGRDFFSFVAQNKQDHELFMSEVRYTHHMRRTVPAILLSVGT